MAEVKSAAFKFKRFKIPEFSYLETSKPDEILKLDFIPFGKYSLEDGIFELQLDFYAYEEGEKENRTLYVKFLGYFEFEKGLPFNEIPGYFYKNAIAIIFPYIRSFVSTLTLQANANILLLGLMNLSNLESDLIKNTELT